VCCAGLVLWCWSAGSAESSAGSNRGLAGKPRPPLLALATAKALVTAPSGCRRACVEGGREHLRHVRGVCASCG
jgi:hypothetical protein